MAKNPNKKIKVGYVLSYRAPDYVRTRFLLQTLQSIPEVSLSTAINSTTSFLRYPQTIARLIRMRLLIRPDVYILGFRGHEIYWLVRLLTYPKPIIFDEFINMQDWLTTENRKLSPDSLLAKLAKNYTKSVLKSSKFILSDTKLGVSSSSQTYGIPLSEYKVIYVGADEKAFKPQKSNQNRTKLQVFFYGNLAPLHGINHILEAAKQLRDEPVHITIIGGHGKPRQVEKIIRFIEENNLKNVTYKKWVSFSKLPTMIADADIFLGGPFGSTSQSKRVITGKTYQALAMAVPTVVGKIEEETGFKDKSNCLLVGQGSASEITKAIKWSMANRGKLPNIGKAGRVLYENLFSIKAQSTTIKELLYRATS